ncbi:11240_t:CDS:10, partial [Acaulospora morrowiae]
MSVSPPTNSNVPPISVGLYRLQEDPDASLAGKEAREVGYDFITLPITLPSYRRFLFDQRLNDITVSRAMEEWRKRYVFSSEDLVLKNAALVDYAVGKVSDWIDLDSPDHDIRINSEIALKQQISWAGHLGFSAVLVPFPTESLANYARSLNSVLETLTYTNVWMKVPLTFETEMSETQVTVTWERWNKFRTFCEHPTKLFIALEVTAQLPDDKILDRWFAEPVRTIILPTKIFLTNVKGYPVLSKRHQAFVKKFIKRKANFMILDEMRESQDAKGGLASYQEYVRYLNRTMPELTQVEKFSTGYQDFLQSPLQPLMDNLDSSTYEVFEKDPVKYVLYEKRSVFNEAIYHALMDVSPDSEEPTVIMVLGAGRGPLVTRSLFAADKAQKHVRVYAVEKNPNAFVTLQNMKADVWGDRVTIVFSDMRRWKAPEKADILVSELLGSFGDNELSPECLDGAQKFLKLGGISIPASYTTFISPLSSTKLYNEVAAYKDLAHFETPYVVMFQSITELAEPQKIWKFEHPNKSIKTDDDKMPINNFHNTRYSKQVFEIKESGLLHGIAGYFESVLYKDILMSILPATHSEDMFSWFPIFFPLRTPIYLPAGTKLEIHFWRLTNHAKVWYEWSVCTSCSLNGETVSLGSS